MVSIALNAICNRAKVKVFHFTNKYYSASAMLNFTKLLFIDFAIGQQKIFILSVITNKTTQVCILKAALFIIPKNYETEKVGIICFMIFGVKIFLNYQFIAFISGITNIFISQEKKAIAIALVLLSIVSLLTILKKYSI